MYLSSIYEKIVYWKNNIFLLPTGIGERCFIDETTRLIDAWIRGSPLKNIALKAVIIMASLLLQKSSKDSKAKDHTKAMDWWTFGWILKPYKASLSMFMHLKP